MRSPADATTDVHPPRKDRKPAHPAWLVTIASAVAATLVGGSGAIVRSKDVDRIEARQDKAEAAAAAADRAIIELKADSRNQDRKLDDIKISVDSINVKLDALRDRMPRP